MNKLILVILVAGGVIWDLGSCHRPPPSRHHMRLQRMAPRPHPRPPRHHPPHPNMIPIPQASGATAGVKPHRSYKPRLHIPLLHGLTHRHHPRHHPGHHPGHHSHLHHPHNHHHHHPNHFHTHPGHHHHHPAQHQVQHTRPQQHLPQHHPQFNNPRQPQQQQTIAAAGIQSHRLPQHHVGNAFGSSPGVKPQQQHSPAPFGYPPLGVDATPAHTSPSSAPVGPPRQPLRQFNTPHRLPNIPFGFKQDPEISFGNEQVSDLPTSTGAYHQPTQGILPHTTAAYGETSATPNGFLASTYKGWKPIVKPYQSSYPRGPENLQHRPAGLPDFPRTPQDFPQLSNNHLPGFQLDEFSSGPSGPPQHPHQQQQEAQRGPPENIFDGFANIPDPPQIPNFARPPSATPENNILDFSNPHGPDFNHLPPTGHSRLQQQQLQHIQQQQQQQHSAPGKGQFPQHPTSISHQDFTFAGGQHHQNTPRDVFPQFHPTGESSSIGEHHGHDNTNPIFRDNILQMKPQHLQQSNRGNILKQGLHHHHHHQHQHAPNSQDVVVPIPEIGDSVRLPNSIFNDNSWTQSNRDQPFEASQSEENIVIKKPQKFNSKLKLNQGGPPIPSSDETVEAGGPLTVLPKFKPPRSRLNKNNNNDEGKLDGSDNRESQKTSLGSDEGQGPKNKPNGGRGRVRIRTRLRRPNPFSNSGEEENTSGPGSSINNNNNNNNNRPFPPFPGTKNESPRRPPFRKIQPDQDNNLSTETPNNSAPEGPGTLGVPQPPGHIKGPISEELSNFPTLPFPPPEPDFIRDFPAAPVPPAPVPPPPSPQPKEREPSRHAISRPQLGIRQNSVSSVEHLGGGQRDVSIPSRPNLRRRRPKPPPKQEQHIEHNNDSSEPPQSKGRPGEFSQQNNQPLPALNANGPLFSDEFFFPPGFNADPSKHNADGAPVSFITMPNAKPNVIHHGLVQAQQQNPSSLEVNQPQVHVPQPSPQPNLYRGPHTTPQLPLHNNYPPLEEFGLQGVNAGPYIRPNPAHGGVQLPSYSEHMPFRPPPRGRKPPRGNLLSTKTPPPHILNPYAYPTSNPYAVTGPYGDSTPQTSNSYEVPDNSGMFGGGVRPGPVYHPPTPVHHPHLHPGPAPHIPAPSQLPPTRPTHLPPPPPRGRLPGGGRIPPPHHRKPLGPPVIEQGGMSQSTEFEQIPAQYVDVSSLPTSSVPTVSPTQLTSQARLHEHHSPDIHPPGSFFDDFFKPFDDSFVQKPGEAGAAQRADGPNMEPGMEHDEQQSQSNVQVNVVPSPKNHTETKERKPWSKLKVNLKEEKSGDSTEKPGRRETPGKKPLSGRFNNKSHLKAKIADIARKNFQSHMTEATEGKDGEENVAPAVTTYKPAILESSSSNNNPTETSSSGGSKEHTTLKLAPTWNKNTEDDLADSNTPKSVRISKNESGPMLIHHRGKNVGNNEQEHPQDGTTILFKSKRQFRRKRPGQPAKPAPEPQNQETQDTPRSAQFIRSHRADIPSDAEESKDSSGTTRVGVIRRRKLFPRRKNFSLSTKDSTQAPDNPEPAESVTYGESQWFRVKKMESGEEDTETHHHEDGLSTPNPTPETKTVSANHPESRDDLSSSSSNNISISKTRKIHSESVTSSVSSTKDEASRVFGKKSSKFLMNRLSMA